MCMMVYMSRTNIDIDDQLVGKVMERYGLKTKKEAVDLALRRMVGTVFTREDVLAMEGAGWDGDLAEIRGGVVIIEEIE